MNAHVDHLLDEALGLPAAERAALTVALLDSLEGSDDSSIAEAWRQEIRSRQAALRAGTVEAVSWAEARARPERSVTRFGVEILPEAEAEIREAFLWYFERSPIAADAFRTETLGAIDRLGISALMWLRRRGCDQAKHSPSLSLHGLLRDSRQYRDSARCRAPTPQARILARALRR
jgi:putative addiction module component (TIGR02574 family)